MRHEAVCAQLANPQCARTWTHTSAGVTHHTRVYTLRRTPLARALPLAWCVHAASFASGRRSIENLPSTQAGAPRSANPQCARTWTHTSAGVTHHTRVYTLRRTPLARALPLAWCVHAASFASGRRSIENLPSTQAGAPRSSGALTRAARRSWARRRRAVVASRRVASRRTPSRRTER